MDYTLLALGALFVGLIFTVQHSCELAAERRRLMLENIQLHQANNRLSWDNSLLISERKLVAMEYGLTLAPWRTQKREARRDDHAH